MRVQIDIIGPSPSDVPIEDLAKVLEELSAAVSSFIEAKDSKDSNLSSYRVSLVGVVDGSDGLVLEVQPQAARALGSISRALKSRRYDELPRATHVALHNLNQFTARRSWGLRFRKNSRANIQSVEVVEPSHVYPPAERKTLVGGTTLIARCLRVGGATVPRAELRLPGQRLLHVEVTESVARDLGKRLYEEVALSGQAVWDPNGGELLEFKVDTVTSYQQVPIDVAFRELARAADGQWNDVDALEFVRSVRDAVS